VESIVDGPYPEEEVAISFKSNGELSSAVVPANQVDKDGFTVNALAVGEAGEYSLVALPAGSSGATIVLVRRSRLLELVG
jgi:hypothetical protein